ncbi:hypothetical protein [Ammoniphilus resinae]|nr:hypothetical protein [Ammoniphilus resinae]
MSRIRGIRDWNSLLTPGVVTNQTDSRLEQHFYARSCHESDGFATGPAL